MSEEKNLGGRPYGTKDFSLEELQKEFEEYVEKNKLKVVKNGYDKVVSNPLSITSFCLWLGKGKNYISQLENDSSYSGLITYIRTFIEDNIANGSMLGIYNPTIAAKNLSANYGWTDKTEIKQDTTVEFIIKE